MASRLRSFKSKLSNFRTPHTTSHQSGSTTSQLSSQASPQFPPQKSDTTTSCLPSQTSSRTVTETIPPQPTSANTNISLPSLQEQLWNRAYDELKASEPKIVSAYESILSKELDSAGVDSNGVDPEKYTKNEISQAPDTRCHQMQLLVKAGLVRTQRMDSIKQGLDGGLEVIKAVRGIVDGAVQAAPQAAIAWVGVCMGLEILSKPLQEARSNRTGIVYVLSRMNWYWNLAQCLLDENKAVKASADLRYELEKRVIELYQKLLLYQIKSVCNYRQKSLVVIGRDLLSLDNWEHQLLDIQKAEDAVKRDAEQYNSEQVIAHISHLATVARSQEEKLNQIHSAIQSQTQQQEERHQDEKDKQCLKDLLETHPRRDKKRIQETKGVLLRDSYRWILENPDFRQFQDDPQNRLLWIKGDPGKGKTMLLCGIIDELQKESTSNLSYFFCQATVAQLSNAASVLRGLIYLLLDERPSLIAHVRAKYDTTGEKLFQDINAWVSLVEIFTEMLKDPVLKDAIFVVDALDECTIDRPKLLDLIVKSSSASSSQVKWIVSSRNWPDIEEGLEMAKQKVRLQLELNQEHISEAVKIYIQYQVEQLAHIKKYDEETRNSVQQYLVENANSTFLWVALVCQELIGPNVRKRHTLTKLRAFPPGLNSVYRQMTDFIEASEDFGIYKDILAVVSTTLRPLSLEELKCLTESLEDFDHDELCEIVTSCGSFLTLQDGTVYFVHQSAKDYLIKDAADVILPSGISHQHYSIFSRSLQRMSETLHRDIYHLRAPGSHADHVSPPVPNPLSPIRYSIINWIDHLCGIEKGFEMEQTEEKINEFWRDHFLHWIEALSLMRSISHGVLAIAQLIDLLMSLPANYQLLRLAQDAHRFVMSGRGAIEGTPLQTYISALLFSPTHSLTRDIFKAAEPDWVISKPTTEMDWDACIQTLEGHSRQVSCVAISSDSRQIASGSLDFTIKIWNPSSGACIQTLRGHSKEISSVAFSADGCLASGSMDSTIKIWNPVSGICLQTLKGHTKGIFSIVFLRNDCLASASLDQNLKIWDLNSSSCIRILEGHTNVVSSIAFSHDKLMASASDDDTIKVWNPTSGACIQTLSGHRVNDRHSSQMTSLALSHDGHLASGASNGTINIWNLGSNLCIQAFRGHSQAVTSIAFSHDSRQMISASHDKTIKIWDPASGVCIQTLEGHTDMVNAVGYLSNSQIVSASHDCTVKIWDPSVKNTRQQGYESHSKMVSSITFSHNGHKVASASFDCKVKIWDSNSGICLQTLEGHNKTVRFVAFSYDDELVASASNDSTIRIWDPASGICTQILSGHSDSVRFIAFSNDNQQIASASEDMMVKVWSLESGACIKTLEGHESPVKCVAFSHNGRQLASASSRLLLNSGWDISSCRWTISKQLEPVIKVWDLSSGACTQTLEACTENVVYVTFSQDDSQLAWISGQVTSVSIGPRLDYRDHTIKIWDLNRGICAEKLQANFPLFHLSFDTAGSTLLTGKCKIPLDTVASTNPTVTSVTQEAWHQGYGLSTDNSWVLWNDQQVVWLPSQYRPSVWAVTPSAIAIGSESGRVVTMRFSAEKLTALLDR